MLKICGLAFKFSNGGYIVDILIELIDFSSKRYLNRRNKQDAFIEMASYSIS